MKHDILTVTGKKFNLLDMSKNEFDRLDIAHGLSNICRFAGQCRKYYSVAQHSILVSYLVEDPKQRLAALMHDAQEAFIGDIPTPIKALLPDYQVLESRVVKWLESETGLTFNTPEIKRADMMALAIEKHHLMPKDDVKWDCDQFLAKGLEIVGEQKLPLEILASYSLTPSAVDGLFLKRYEALTK